MLQLSYNSSVLSHTLGGKLCVTSIHRSLDIWRVRVEHWKLRRHAITAACTDLSLPPPRFTLASGRCVEHKQIHD